MFIIVNIIIIIYIKNNEIYITVNVDVEKEDI